MKKQIKCPRCNHKINLDEEYNSKERHIQCPNCELIFINPYYGNTR